MFVAFQAVSALLLLAAAASSYLAASGLLRALASIGDKREGGGLVGSRFRHVNRFDVPPWGILVVLLASIGLLAAARGRDQVIVQFYAVSVFAGFLGALLGCARLSYREGRSRELAVNVVGVGLVAFVLALNVARTDGAIALAASGLIAAYLYRVWVMRGRPAGVGDV